MKSRYTARFLFKVIFVAGVVLVVVGFLLLELILKKDKQELFDGAHSGPSPEVMRMQKLVDYLSRNLSVRYRVISNLIDDVQFVGKFKAELTLQNTGDNPITAGSWALFFHHPYMVLPETRLEKFGIKWSHINGDLFNLEPTDSFQDLPPGGSITLPLVASHWLVARSDMLPNWYIVAPDAQPRILKCTAGESINFLGSFDKPAQWKRVAKDVYDPFSLTQRYAHNFVPWQKVGPGVVPSPLKSDFSQATLSINKDDWVIVADKQTMDEARFLNEATGIQVTTQSRQSKCIILTVGNVDVPEASGPRGQQAYSLQIDQQKQLVSLKGQSSTGVFYGIQTLLSLGDDKLDNVPVGHITDAPRYEYRGFMMDVSRNFFPKKDILVILDMMAMYKLNRLHLHLTDDQGWRLEIPGLPDLTQIGSKRSYDLKELTSLLVTLGSGPFTNSSGSGFYTVDEYKEILKYAKVRHIKVIPEIDMPGHSHAAIISMEGRHRSHGNDEYTLIDRQDKSTYLSIQQFRMNSMNPCIESTYHFIEHVVRELVAMHKDISPLETFHFGGDEVPGNASLRSPACRKLGMTSTATLKEMFVKRVSQIAHKHGLQLQGWGDVFFVSEAELLDPSKLETKEIYSHAWTSRHYTLHRSHLLANAGYRVILSLASYLYFDHPQEPDPEERGNYWAARYIDTQKVFKYRSKNVYDNIDVDWFGRPVTRDAACSSTVNCVPLKKPENIIGIQSQVWTETIRTRSQLDDMLYPRLLAFAERAWHEAPWEKSAKDPYSSDWATFANRLGQKELARLERRGIEYYLPPPGVINEKLVVEIEVIQEERVCLHGSVQLLRDCLRTKDNRSVDVNVAFPGLKVQYSSNGGRSWSNIGEQTVVNGDILLASRSFDSTRRSRAVLLKLGSQPIAIRVM